MDIIFDLDGTLWDSSAIILQAWNDVFKKNQLPLITKEDLAGVIGLDMFAILAKLQPSADHKVLEQMIENEEQYLRKYKKGIYKNTKNTIERLSKEYRLFIVSNCQQGYIELFLEIYDLGNYFTDHLCWGDTRTKKGQTIRTLMEKNDITEACYVGDTRGDEIAASDADIPFIYAAYGFGSVNDDTYSIDHISGLKKVLQSLENNK